MTSPVIYPVNTKSFYSVYHPERAKSASLLPGNHKAVAISKLNVQE